MSGAAFAPHTNPLSPLGESSVDQLTTLVDGEVKRVKQASINQHALYLVAWIDLVPELGWYLYHVDLCAKDPPLKGAVIHLLDGGIAESIQGRKVAYYQLPAELEIAEGPVAFNLISGSSK